MKLKNTESQQQSFKDRIAKKLKTRSKEDNFITSKAPAVKNKMSDVKS